jgi:CRP-like cAMP-binding protein
MQVSAPPENNRLLASFPQEVFRRIAPELQPVTLFLGAVLYEPGSKLKAAYFPISAILSLHYVTVTGASVETASVGLEGMLGVTLLMGGQTPPSSAVVVTSGQAYRLDPKFLIEEFAREPAVRSLLLRYTQGLLTQMCQNAVCHRHHSVENQLSRWLLHMADRHPEGQLVMTHELLSHILGVRRESVTEVAGRLQSAGCVSYRRGHIAVLDRTALEKRACECYGMLRKEWSRLLPAAPQVARVLQAA